MERHVAIVIVDAQNAFITGELGDAQAVAATPSIVALVEGLADNATEIDITQDMHTDDYLDTREGRHLPIVHGLRGTDGWRVHEDVEDAVARVTKGRPRIEVTRWEKTTFGCVELARHLARNGRGADALVFCGMKTDICVIANVLATQAAANNEIDIIVAADACSATTPARHEAALEVLRSCQVDVMGTRDVIALVTGRE